MLSAAKKTGRICVRMRAHVNYTCVGVDCSESMHANVYCCSGTMDQRLCQWWVLGFEEWTSFLRSPDKRIRHPLLPLLLLPGSLLLRTELEGLQLLLQGSLWAENFKQVPTLPAPQSAMMSLQVFSICRQRQNTRCYITNWTATCSKV